MKRNLLFATLFLLAGLSRAQEFGGFPPSTRWKQINTDTARVIFMPGAEDQAQRVASLLHRMAADTPVSLGGQLRKIDVVLHNRTTLANGYVGLAPFRSEYFLVPGSSTFDFGNLPWHENLAVHEYRHVQQFNNFRNGISKALYYLFGERGQALANAVAVPDWFWEGDAVYAETALTPQGRGRLPYFLSAYNSLWLSGKEYSWMKLRNGSFKDYVPNHYHLGYLLVNYGYLKYGPSFWQKVTHDATSYKGLVYPFQRAVKTHSGVDFKTFRQQALDYYRQQLGARGNELPDEGRTPDNYFFPQYIGTDSLLYLRSAYDRIAAFYIKTASGEKRIAQKSIGSEEWFSYRNGTIAYTAYKTDPRWALVDYSDIVLLDIRTGREKRITQKERYFTPDLSPSGNLIAAVHASDSLLYELRILDRNGGLLQRIAAPQADAAYFNPRFIDENRVITAVRSGDAKMSWMLYDLSSPGKPLALSSSTYSTVGLPQAEGDTVYFSANYGGNDDLYALKLSNKKLYRLTADSTGNYYGHVSGDSIVYSKFTAAGLRVRREALSGLLWRETAPQATAASPYPVASAGQNLLSAQGQRFAEKRYEKSTGLFHFHSWSPDYTDPELTLSLYSDNILNTFSNTLYYRYNINETSHGVGWNTSYGGFFPKLNAGAEYTFGRDVLTTRGQLTLNQLEARLGYNIPLNFTAGKTGKFLNFGSNYVFNRTMPTGILKDSFLTSSSSYLHHFITWSHQLPRAVQQIYPRFSFATSLHHRHRLSESGFQFIGTTQLALPSFKNHSIVLSASLQETDTSNVIFSNRFSNARGYPDYYYTRMWRASANYHMPLFYPDWGLANIVYFKRVRSNFFYDFSRVYSRNKTVSRDLRSAGVELFADTQWWNMLPLTIGVRYSYLLDKSFDPSLNRVRFEVALPLDLIPD